MAFHSRNFFISSIIFIITFSFLIDKFQDTTVNLFLLETSSQTQQDAIELFEQYFQTQQDIELFEKYFRQEQEQYSTELVPVRPYPSADALYEMFSDEFLDQYWKNFGAAANYEPIPVIF